MTIYDCPLFFDNHFWLATIYDNNCWLFVVLYCSFMIVCRPLTTIVDCSSFDMIITDCTPYLITIGDGPPSFDDHCWLSIVLRWSLQNYTVLKYLMNIEDSPQFFDDHCWLPLPVDDHCWLYTIISWPLLNTHGSLTTIADCILIFNVHCWLSIVIWWPLLTVHSLLVLIIYVNRLTMANLPHEETCILAFILAAES
jgi:hypothetical protein